MQELRDNIKTDLLSLLKHGYVKEARNLNTILGKGDLFAERCTPMYFTGNIDAKTVFVMLNPGSNTDIYDLKADSDIDIDILVNQHISSMEAYGSDERERMRIDNFDLKQAAFLYEFKDSGIEIPDFFTHKERVMSLLAKERVLTQKLQLELIPYASREFITLFDSYQSAMHNVPLIEKHINRLFDTIVTIKRKYVLLGSKQHYYILWALKSLKLKEVELHEPVRIQIDGLKKAVYFNTAIVHHNNEPVQVGIPYSFPRRDLPNAFEKMREYGKCCFLEMSIRFGSLLY